jgi:hypothetical protein
LLLTLLLTFEVSFVRPFKVLQPFKDGTPVVCDQGAFVIR